jgi:pyridoxine 5-phosphate synthase
MPKLFLNVDHVATLREARKTIEPDPVQAALLAEKTGVQGITVHLREDRRHIQDRDVYRLRKEIKTVLNLEMAAVEEIIGIAKDVKPEFATFVPEKREEITTEGGLKVSSNKNHIKKAVNMLQEEGIIVSLFVDPDIDEIQACCDTEAKSIEINTGRYSEAKDPEEIDNEFEKISHSINHALDLGLKVNAGHGLDYRNIKKIAEIEGISEFNIGHNIIARAVFIGLEKAVKEMINLIK